MPCESTSPSIILLHASWGTHRSNGKPDEFSEQGRALPGKAPDWPHDAADDDVGLHTALSCAFLEAQNVASRKTQTLELRADYHRRVLRQAEILSTVV